VTTVKTSVRPAFRRRPNLTPVIFLSPTLALFAIFIAYPFLRAIWLSFSNTTLFGQVTGFAGFSNYSSIFADPAFSTYVSNSLEWTFGGVFLQLVFGTIGALMLNQRFKLRGAVRGLAMVPWATPSILVALMWMWLLDPNHGLINSALLHLNIIHAPIAFLSDQGTALPTLIAIDAWQGIPFFAIMILAALQSVPPELKESASTDGCGPVKVFTNVVIPHILPTVLIVVVLRIIWTANYIDLAYVLTGGGPGHASTTVPLQSYLTAYKSGDFGGGAAYAMIQAVVLAILVTIYVRLTNRREPR
jgi:multiple sugar transport system permease protein